MSGPIGAAGLGLRALTAGLSRELFAPVIARWRAPTARLAHGRAVRGRATACVDVSDGLAQDAAHLAAASGVALVLDLPALRALLPAELTGAVDDLDAVIAGGGEDYELLATGPREAFDDSWAVVGEAREGDGVYGRAAGGCAPLTARGWDHFSLT